MLTDNIVVLRLSYSRNITQYSQSFILDISSPNNKVIELNQKTTVIKWLSTNRLLLAISNVVKIYKFPFESLEAEIVLDCFPTSFMKNIFDVFELKDGRLLVTNINSLCLVDIKEKANIDLMSHLHLWSLVQDKITGSLITSIYEYKNGCVLIRDIGYHENISYLSHIYALDLNVNKFLYTINPYGDYRYCFIFEPLKRMNVALSFDLAYLEIWNLESVQCNTKIPMSETQRVFESDNRQLVFMSKRGIRVVNAKY